MTTREELRTKWMEWVFDNIGRDPTRASTAAEAAYGASVAGDGFATAADAARTAWRRAATTERMTMQASRRNGLGLLAFVLGATSCSLLLVAREAYFALFAGLFGLLFLAALLPIGAALAAMAAIGVGIGALQRKARKRGMAMAGLAMGLMTTVCVLWWVVASATAPVG